MINRTVLVGHMTKDPELRKTSSGNSVCSFTIAINNRSKSKEEKPTASYIPCVAFNQTADLMIKHTRKGSLLGVEGRLSQRSFVRQDGSKGSVLEVLCDSVQFLGPKRDVENEEPNVPPFDDITNDTDSNKNTESFDVPDDDTPF